MFRSKTTRIFQALLAADEPLGRGDIIDRADTSGSTYDRWIETFRAEFTALGLIKEVSVNGYARMIGTVEPYWAREGGREDHAIDYSDAVVEEIEDVLAEHAPGLSRRNRPKDVLFEVAAAVDIDLQATVWGYDHPIEEVYGLDPALSSWRPLLIGLFEGPRDREDFDGLEDESIAMLGRYPDAVNQPSLTEALEKLRQNGIPDLDTPVYKTGGS